MSVSVDPTSPKSEADAATEQVPQLTRKRHPKEAAREASAINLSVNLTEAAIGHLELLELVDEYPCLYCGPYKRRAIKRYEEFWLPLVASQREYLPAPLDIEWIWHCHLLAPKAYIADCERLFGRIIDHKIFRMDEREIRLLKSQELWEKKYPNEPFIVDLPDAECYGPDIDQSICTHTSRLGYNIESATCRQGKFFHNVRLPHYRDKKYIRLAFERYQKFLYLKQSTEKTFLVPCYDIDLIWHTHQLHPIKYKEDTEKLLGFMLTHDDTTTDRSDGSKLSISYKITGTLWHELYGEAYQYPGAMYRGENTRGAYDEPSINVPSEVQHQTPVMVNFDFMALEKGRDGQTVKQFQVDVFLDFKDEVQNPYDNGRKLLMSLTGPNMECIAGEARPFEYDPVSHNSLVIRLVKFRKEDNDNMSERSASTKSGMVIMGTIQEKDETIGSKSSLRSQNIVSARSKSEESMSLSSGFGSGDSDLMSEKSKESFLEAKFDIGGIGDWVSATEKMFQEAINFEDSHREQYVLYVSGRIEDRSDLCHFTLLSEEFETILYPKDLGVVTIPEYTIYDPKENCNACYFADQKMRDDQNNISFICRVMHSPIHTISAVQIFREGAQKPIVTVKLVDSSQLPLPGMVFNGSRPCITLDPRYKERAMLIQDNNGDWAIVVGSWFVNDEVLGALRFKLYKCNSGIIKTLILPYEQHKCRITIDSCTIDFQNGRLEIDAKSSELVQNIGLAFAISILHVLCVPRPENWKPGEPVQTEKTKHVFSDTMLFALGVGLKIQTPTNQYREKRRKK